jgi:hypothetical protein
VAGFWGLLLVSSCTFIAWGNEPPSSVEQPPLYPGAAQVSDSTVAYVRTIVLLTDAAPESILEFYKSSLRNDGWKEDQTYGAPMNSVYFSWNRSNKATSFTLDVVINSSNERNEIVIKLVKHVGR